jgi:hypothetical protein
MAEAFDPVTLGSPNPRPDFPKRGEIHARYRGNSLRLFRSIINTLLPESLLSQTNARSLYQHAHSCDPLRILPTAQAVACPHPLLRKSLSQSSTDDVTLLRKVLSAIPKMLNCRRLPVRVIVPLPAACLGHLFLQAGCTLFLNAHFLSHSASVQMAPLAGPSRPAGAWIPCSTSSAQHTLLRSPPATSCGKLITGWPRFAHPSGGISLPLRALQAIHSRRNLSAPPDCTGSARASPSPRPQSWRLTCLNCSQSVAPIVQCCTPH